MDFDYFIQTCLSLPRCMHNFIHSEINTFMLLKIPFQDVILLCIKKALQMNVFKEGLFIFYEGVEDLLMNLR